MPHQHRDRAVGPRARPRRNVDEAHMPSVHGLRVYRGRSRATSGLRSATTPRRRPRLATRARGPRFASHQPAVNALANFKCPDDPPKDGGIGARRPCYSMGPELGTVFRSEVDPRARSTPPCGRPRSWSGSPPTEGEARREIPSRGSRASSTGQRPRGPSGITNTIYPRHTCRRDARPRSS